MNICLDGPLNGQYVTFVEAVENGYKLDTWPNAEPVYIQSSENISEEPEGLDD